MSTDWTMPRRADACTACQRPFAAGEVFHAFLYEAPDGYERRDFCPGCPPPPDRTPIASWKTRRTEPAARRSLTFDRQAVYGVFERLDEAREPRQIQFRFILALLLWRKKVLRLTGTAANADGEVWEFTPAAGDGVHRVRRPELDEEQLEQLSAQLEQLLAGGAEPLEAAAAEPGEEVRND